MWVLGIHALVWGFVFMPQLLLAIRAYRKGRENFEDRVIRTPKF